MKTTYTVYRVDGTTEKGEVDWPERPGYNALRPMIEKILDGGNLGHVSVMHPEDGRYADMFVDDDGLPKRLPVNAAATVIYRAYKVNEGAVAASLPQIYGVAILFDRRVWF